MFIKALGLLILISTSIMLPIVAQAEGWKDTFESFKWKQRQIILFSDVEDNPAFIKQKEILVKGKDALSERKAVVHFVVFDNWHEVHHFHKVPSQGFTFMLIGLDGQEKFRSKRPVSIEKISAVIDRMPMRLRELRIQRLQSQNR